MGFRLGNVRGRGVLVEGDSYFNVETLGGASSDPVRLLADPDSLSAIASRLADSEPTGAIADVKLGPPVPNPQKVFGIGLNYRAHAAEGGREAPDSPLVFTKFPSCLAGPTADVEIRSDACDYEGELVVVIGRGGRDITIAEAWDHVVGLTIGQDISDRPMQRASNPPQFNLGKSYDTFGPIGPTVVSLDDVADRNSLHIVTEVNGEVRQDATTADLIFDVPTLVSFLSSFTTLVTGDLIFTGTPAGVGVAQDKWLADGDVITTRIDGIGTMTNRCVRVADPRPVRG